jgi:cell division cycle 20-like protein 1 (cofactor of APC complex)
MSGLKNSPFGKRLRASHREPVSTTAATDDDLAGSRSTPPFNPIFGISSTPSLSLDSSSTLIENRENGGSESPTRNLRGSPKRQRFLGGGIGMGGMGIVREYGDRFVPSKDSGDLRTSYHLMEEGGGGPSTPSKSRIIPSESDALKGAHPLSFIYSEKLTNL